MTAPGRPQRHSPRFRPVRGGVGRYRCSRCGASSGVRSHLQKQTPCPGTPGGKDGRP